MSHLCLLSVATLTLTSAGFAGSDTNADLQARLEAAEARISELSAAANTNWLNDARADEIRGLIHDVLADADTRASLQGSGATAGYNNGFTIGSADGNWSLRINGLLQERWIHNEIDVPFPGLDDDARGFENARTTLNFSGTIAGDYGYDIRLTWGSAWEEMGPIQWAYGTMDLGNDWTMSAGTMKLPTNREWMINAEYQLAVERSTTSAIASLDGDFAFKSATSTGVMFNYTGDEIRFWFGYLNGLSDMGSPNGSYSDNDRSSTWIVRGEYKIDGTWDQFDEFTSQNDGEVGTLLGFSYLDTSWGDDLSAWLSPLDSNSAWSVDAQLQFGGANLYVLYTRHDIDLPLVGDWNPTTFEIMGGFYLNDDWELYARLQNVDADIAGIKDFETLTIGVVYYMAGHNAKWTTDVSWADDGWLADPIAGWRDSELGSDQTMIRTQLQFYF